MALKEVAIATFDSDNPDGVRIGDIVTVRVPRGEIGRLERALFLWVLMDDEQLADGLPLIQPEEDGLRRKRRYRVDLASLAADEKISLARVLDTRDEYQPILTPDSRTGQITTTPVARDASLDIIDKRGGSVRKVR